jgi:predicted ABC-type ATPase
VAFESARIMLNRINELINLGETFAFETTLSTKSYRLKIEQAKAKGYEVILFYFWLQNVDLAKERVKTRVLEGGYNIATEIIERRYLRGIKNLFNIYIPIVDRVLIFDNSLGEHELLAQKAKQGGMSIIDLEKYNQIKKLYANS